MTSDLSEDEKEVLKRKKVNEAVESFTEFDSFEDMPEDMQKEIEAKADRFLNKFFS